MHMKQISLFILFLFQFSLIDAQELCKTPAEMNSTTREVFAKEIKVRSNTNYLIRVYFHIIRRTNGTGASIVQNNVQTAFNTLNTDFNPHGIYFTWDNSIDYINSDSYYYNPGVNIFSVNNHSNGVDIYLYGENVCIGGYANGIANSTEYYIGGYLSSFPSLYLSGTHVVSHEMGHVLGLYHTHRGTSLIEPDGCPELVNGSNSSVCGDEIEDTPADPCLNYDVNPYTGQWQGSGTDANGDPYQPDTHLIMSYTHPSCMSYFSTEQGERMIYAIGHVSSLQSVTVSADKIVGPQLVYTNATYNINNLPSGVTVEWSLSNSYYNQNCLQQNYPSTNQCTITRSSSHDMMGATLTAAIKYSGVTIQTLTKTVYAYSDFYGQYTSDNLSGTINYTHTFNVKPGYTTVVSSPNFEGGTASYDNTGTTPSYFYLDPTISKLYFTMPTNNNGYPVVINVNDGCGNYYQLYAIPQNYLYLEISNVDGEITVTLHEKGEDSSKSVVTNQPWTIEICNASSGVVMATQSSTSRSVSISTSTWPKGLYIVKATVGKEELTEKVIVK